MTVITTGVSFDWTVYRIVGGKREGEGEGERKSGKENAGEGEFYKSIGTAVYVQ